jgi:hypothetical protein
MKQKMKFSLFLLLTVILLISCKKEATIKSIAGGFIYQYGANVPVEGVTVKLFKSEPNCFDFINGCFNVPEGKNTTTGADGSFEIDKQTVEIQYDKNGYFPGIAAGFSSDPILYINKIAWAKYHITNPDAKKIDTLMFVSYSYNAPLQIMGKDTTFQPTDAGINITITGQTDTTINSLVIADAENYLSTEYQTKDLEYVSVMTDSFFVKSGDTAQVEIKIK